jgi:prevent-host-death family protein
VVRRDDARQRRPGEDGPSKLLARVEAGEDVEIARDGVPVARVVPVDPLVVVQRRAV